MRPPIRSITLLVGLLSACAATPALAQTKDQTHQAAERASVDSAQVAAAAAATLDSATGVAVTKFCGTKTSASYGYMRAVCANPAKARDRRAVVKRTLARADSIELAFVAPFVPASIPAPPPAPTPAPAPAPAPSPEPPKDSTVVVAPPPPPPVVDSTPPAPAIFSHPFGPPANGVKLAALPADTVDAAYPAIVRRVPCTNLQLCLDTAKTGDEVLLARGASFTDIVVRPTARALWTVVRTDVTDVELGGPWERMTVSKAGTLNLASIRSSGTSTPAITVASGAHHVRFVGVRVTTSAPVTNALVRIGLGENTVAQLPHHITLDRVVVDPTTNDLRRCVAADGAYLAVLSSTLANCHSNISDSQGILAINARGPLRIENNTIQGGHQSIMFGGGDPAIVGQVPSDIVIRRNDLSRPLSWRRAVQDVYNAGEWQGKTNIEFKIGKRALIEGNVLCHTWADAQTGHAFLLKTENQNGSAPWSETSDITVRYNRVCGASAGFNLAPLPRGPGVAFSRATIYNNELDSISVGPFASETGECLLLQGVADVVYMNNWCRNPTGRAAIYAAGTSARFVATGNAFGGEYGLKGDAVAFATWVPGSIVTNNTLLPFGTAFTAWPASPVDSTRAALLRGVVVAP